MVLVIASVNYLVLTLVSGALHASSLSYGARALRVSVDVNELRNLSSHLVITFEALISLQ